MAQTCYIDLRCHSDEGMAQQTSVQADLDAFLENHSSLRYILFGGSGSGKSTAILRHYLLQRQKGDNPNYVSFQFYCLDKCIVEAQKRQILAKIG